MRLAETPVCLWRECVPSAAPTAALAPVLLHPTHSNPAPLSHRARDLTGSCQWMFSCVQITIKVMFHKEINSSYCIQHV